MSRTPESGKPDSQGYRNQASSRQSIQGNETPPKWMRIVTLVDVKTQKIAQDNCFTAQGMIYCDPRLRKKQTIKSDIRRRI